MNSGNGDFPSSCVRKEAAWRWRLHYKENTCFCRDSIMYRRWDSNPHSPKGTGFFESSILRDRDRHGETRSDKTALLSAICHSRRDRERHPVAVRIAVKKVCTTNQPLGHWLVVNDVLWKPTEVPVKQVALLLLRDDPSPVDRLSVHSLARVPGQSGPDFASASSTKPCGDPAHCFPVVCSKCSRPNVSLRTNFKLGTCYPYICL
jgi:hypothetical protein